MPRHASIDWLEFGLGVLGREGQAALVPEKLAGRAGLTRGSFYHRFPTVADFHAALLERWRERNTEAVIALSAAAAPGAARQAVLLAATASIDHGLDRAVRAWALYDAQARVAVAAVDRARIAYVAKNLEGPRAGRQALARALYVAYVGAQQVYPDLSGPALRKLIDPIDGWLILGAAQARKRRR